MRIGGLASGMDIDKLVNDLMKAERIPLQKMEQDRTWMTWQRDAYREMNTLLYELDQQALNLKLDKTFNSKSTTSSQLDSITATATTEAKEGSYEIEVKQLATAAINVSQSGISATNKKIDPNNSLQAEADAGNLANTLVTGPLEFTVYREDGPQDYSINVQGSDSLNDVLNKITNQDNGVRAFYDSQTDKVVLERTETGDYNQSNNYLGAEIAFNGSTSSGFFTETLQIKNGDNSTGTWKKVEKGGTNAEFIYNNALTLESSSNSYTLNGITFNFSDKTNGNAIISVNSNIDSTVEKITGFVDKYNELIEKFSDRLNEERYRDYKPLSDKEKESMTEKQVELWEEKAKSGLLRNDGILQNSLYDMRRAWYSEIENNNDKINLISDIGITTSSNYLENGKLIVDEEKLKQALREDPDAVQNLFSNDNSGESRGIVNRLEDVMKNTMSRINERAGKSSYVFSQYTIGRNIDDLNDEINQFEERLTSVENRYWNQFTQMEKAIQQMNQQSAFLMNQFGGGM
ncbi:flagellar hook-associated protein 2 [Filobacillus milosensis]|uniref:Flagellar hook-associated protein 2 n=1 Tax=Filobacillus milosensis TaxID=94137 RepID=A0A4Y8ITW8_9BACI|nr:flagellar hook-associated protein 2 [Filobacillus milosensis]TFB24489.1 flagellar hook-associated protein 2 [Filobacillus milosensis]